ncbi:TPA: DUF2591 family protein, partial [Salmonella enterica subsp. enterica serovar Mokola]|nr:DUF2591 family protein [Salmonella enterica subsp. enterica serovar Mokola]HDA4107634.1 DUF2591 family protein [Salmonella enterica subsp. enterica serovar Mokola]HDA4157357.1 DUF2591 family protein [Salmonella enterica subsp. enterica serovar Mokola]HDA4179900.1 DUF2591 family protein [Salmonella enterica subsp. enterica serovar Mokola]HDA4562667.1 DUF2591 family protein [Salmonella enterica subsp. enterica serovar Mokola]
SPMSNDITALSDFEINVLVATALHLQVQEIDDSRKTGMTTWYHEQMPNTVWVSNGDEPWYQFAPCNSAEDAWPIIEGQQISLLFNWNEFGLHGATSEFPGHNCEHGNVLRAAMCVFLMDEGVLR